MKQKWSCKVCGKVFFAGQYPHSKFPVALRPYAIHLYTVEKMSLRKVTATIKARMGIYVNYGSINRWLQQEGVEMRKKTCAKNRVKVEKKVPESDVQEVHVIPATVVRLVCAGGVRRNMLLGNEEARVILSFFTETRK